MGTKGKKENLATRFLALRAPPDLQAPPGQHFLWTGSIAMTMHGFTQPQKGIKVTVENRAFLEQQVWALTSTFIH